MVNTVRGGANRNLRSATFLDMMNTGRLTLIEDPILREALIRYYENFPIPQVPTVLEVTGRFVMPLFELMGQHLDERVVLSAEPAGAENPLFVTSWTRFAADPAVTAQLRLASGSTGSVSYYFREAADSTRVLRERLLESLGARSLPEN